MNMNTGRRVQLPLISDEQWRAEAKCTEYMPEPLWDNWVDGETLDQRRARHKRARPICWMKCPVRQECADSADWRVDEGIRGGHLIPSLNVQHTPEEDEMIRLLGEGRTLDDAARLSRGFVSKENTS